MEDTVNVFVKLNELVSAVLCDDVKDDVIESVAVMADEKVAEVVAVV